jgi:uncharacterized protein YbjT (DUF2867 family)
MKIVVIGGSGLVGSQLTLLLAESGHAALAASPKTGVNTLTGEGLAVALEGAQVVVDVSNSPSFEDQAVMEFFRTSTTNLLKNAAEARVGHYVALSVVGTQRLSESGYFRAKIVQEDLIRKSGLPYSIVQATQFFEFVKSIADFSAQGSRILLAPVLIQPMASADVAKAVCTVATGTPINDTVEAAGPDKFRLDELIRYCLDFYGDPREVVVDPDALYSGAHLSERTLVPDGDAILGEIRYKDWLGKRS